jgi:hypothetical protein
MSKFIHLIFNPATYKYIDEHKRKTFSCALSIVGALWLIIEILTFFIGEQAIPIIFIKKYWFTCLLLLIIIVIFWATSKIKLCIKQRIEGRDITIEILAGDLLEQKSTIVIGINTTFDTDISDRLISEKSIQGQFTQKFYKDSGQLNMKISSELQKLQSIPTHLSECRIGKKEQYPMGTTIRLDNNGQAFYLVAMANMNANGKAEANLSDIITSLSCLWEFIRENGNSQEIAIPVLGSGFSGVKEPIERIVQEIITSFIVACSESSFCKRLSVVVYAQHIKTHNIDMEELDKYLYHVCKYSPFSYNKNPKGIPT